METLKDLHYFFTANARIQKSARAATLRRDRKRLHAIAEKAYRTAAATVKMELDKAANAHKTNAARGPRLDQRVRQLLQLGDGMTDNDIKVSWLKAGGSFHGPITETATMPEADIFRFVRGLIAEARQDETNRIGLAFKSAAQNMSSGDTLVAGLGLVLAELSNDRVEGRAAALSRRVPSHDGLCPDGGAE